MNLLLQGLTSLPNELIIVIFNFIDKNTDKRRFAMTCKLYNKLTKKLIKQIDNNFKLIYKLNNSCGNYQAEKITWELCHDLYFDMIPKSCFMRNSIIIDLLIKFGQLELLKYHINNNCETQHIICRKAKEFSNLDLQRGINTYGCVICKKAAKYGDLEILKWARQKRCKMPRTCEIAAKHGHLHIIEWALGNKGKWNVEILENAKKNGHKHIVDFAQENGYCE